MPAQSGLLYARIFEPSRGGKGTMLKPPKNKFTKPTDAISRDAKSATRPDVIPMSAASPRNAAAIAKFVPGPAALILAFWRGETGPEIMTAPGAANRNPKAAVRMPRRGPMGKTRE